MMQVEVADQIDVDDLAPERRVGVDEIHHPVPACIVDQDADTAARAGLEAPATPMTVAPARPHDRITLDSGGRLSGRAIGVPFARDAQHIAVLAYRGNEPMIALAETKDCRLADGRNLATYTLPRRPCTGGPRQGNWRLGKTLERVLRVWRRASAAVRLGELGMRPPWRSLEQLHFLGYQQRAEL